MLHVRMRNCFLLIHIACLNFLPYLDGNQQILISQSLMNFLYENFDIDAFDHFAFLLDNDTMIFEDKTIEDYHEVLTQFGKFNTIISINADHTYMYNTATEKEAHPKFPIMHYILILSLHASKGSQFLQSRSSVSLANYIWLVELHSTDTSGQDLSTQIEALIPNLELDSQVFVFTPMESQCDKFNVYEVYKVANETKVTVHKIAEFSPNEESRPLNITDPAPIWERRSDFQGHVLNAGWRIGPPYIYQTSGNKHSNDSNDNITGVNYDLAFSLARLCNFSLHLEEVDVYGALQEDGNWTGLVEKLRTHVLDIGIADMSITKERADVIDFSIGIQNSEYVLFMKASGEVIKWLTFKEVFSDGFWYCLLTCVISLTIFLCFIQISTLEHKPMAESIVQGFNSSLAIVMLPIGSLGIDNNVKKLSNRIIIFFICLFGTLVYWSYCAVLVSLLTVSDNPLTINKLDDMLGKTDYTLYYMTGTAAYNYFSEATEETNPVAYGIFQEYFVNDDGRSFNVAGTQEANNAMENNSNAILFQTEDSGRLELYGYPCQLTNTKSTYLRNSIAFSFQKNSPYLKIFSYFLLEMRQSGQIDKLYNMHENEIYTMKIEHEKCRKTTSPFFQECLPNEPNCVPAITLKTVWTALLMLSFGVLFGLIVVLLEWLDYHGYLNKGRNSRHNIPNNHSLGKRGILTIYSVAFISFTLLLIVLLFYYVSIRGKISYGQLNTLVPPVF